jgi:NAD(P)-dependent dehydrogenase (short-subunit alcohol dehydrogenase family)
VQKEGRVAVVTGASSGIGAALSRQLAASGARVGLIALPEPALDAEAAAIRDRGGTAEAAAADVTDSAAVHDAVEHLTRSLGPIDLLVLNAGIGLATRVDEPFSAEAVERMVRVNLLGAVYPIEAVLPQMLERRRGHLVGVSSLSSYRGQPVFSGYCASKAGLATLLEGLRIELREHGIAVTTVRPGFVRTPMTAEARAPRFMLEVEEAAAIMLKGISARRPEINFPWQPALLAGLVRWLPRALYDRLVAATVLAKYGSDDPRD